MAGTTRGRYAMQLGDMAGLGLDKYTLAILRPASKPGCADVLVMAPKLAVVIEELQVCPP